MVLNNLNVEHSQKNERFFVNLKNSQAYVQYESENLDILDLKETYVPKKARGKGVATSIVEHVLEHAQKENLQIIPSCPFVQDYIDRNPEYKELIIESA
ncbi:GNAT family N-acetyltransferase [Fulvivirga lutea]|uniref:N-acetyltransferase n=1 Tax=Fulvivirga lutea TaxID=2810512 RepID=A0A974WIC8_9BACT|nr:GNAT family N-acetyltransferase [Fulvivirga lutea]QSE95898.1 N-acetyltransferase [Fulvivirga lutea]